MRNLFNIIKAYEGSYAFIIFVTHNNYEKSLIKKRNEMFDSILYLIFVIIVFQSVQKDSQLYKNQNNKKILKTFFTLLMIFLIYKGIIVFIDLNRFYNDINYYFMLI